MKDGKIVMCDKCICKYCMNICDCTKCKEVHGGYVGYCIKYRKSEQMQLELEVK